MLSSELVICGYPPKDLLFQNDLIEQIENSLLIIARKSPIPIILGAPVKTGNDKGNPFWNAAVCCFFSKVDVIARKTLLPNYDVFDEQRYFESSQENNGSNVIKLGNFVFGITICEDAWNYNKFNPFNRGYKQEPVAKIMANGAQIMLNLSASPFLSKKPQFRQRIFKYIAKKNKIPVIVAGQTGANDHLLFDGSSMGINTKGKVVEQLKMFSEDLAMVVIDNTGELKSIKKQKSLRFAKEFETIESALVCGIRDYVSKCGINGVILGLSGGLDSSVVAALAVKAIGAQRVLGVRLPSSFSSTHSLIDAQKLVDNLNIQTLTIPIEAHVNSFREMLNSIDLKVDEKKRDLCDQNLQARVRANILMSISNLNGYILLGTSNKSELSVGYTTIYGDMCGGLSPLGDLYKTDVYSLAKEINKSRKIIPQNVFKKQPSAELKKEQFDQDCLPPYTLLDAILKLYVDLGISVKKISKKLKIDIAYVEKITRMVHLSEHKRRQAPICLMVSKNVFEISRRWPVAKSFNSYEM